MRIARFAISGAFLIGMASPALAIPVAVVAGVLGVLATSFVAIAVTVVINIGLSLLVSALLAPKAKQGDRQASATTLQLGEQPRTAIFGRAAIAGSLVDAADYGGKYGTDWEIVIFALADHRCKALIGFYVNDAYVAFTGDGSVAGYNDQLEVYWLPGTATQALPAIVTANMPGWTAADNLAGVCCAIVSYNADSPKAKHPVWTAGRPSFLWEIDGAFCYDPRKDATVTGGSGAHLRGDPTTWEWSDNPIVCRYNWVRGIYACDRVDQPDQLLVGRGLTAIEAPPENVAAYANTCDELVALAAGGTEKRYRIGGLISADEDYITTEEHLAAACAGVIVQVEGSVEIEPGLAKTVVATIIDDDIVAGTTTKFSKFRSVSDDLWVNTVVPSYTEPSQKWGTHTAPIRRVYADVIADGKPREDDLALALVTDGTQAQRCGEIARRLGRLVWTAGFTLGPRFAALEEGDWIVWSSARRGTATWRIESYGLDEKWQNTLPLRQIDGSVFDWATTDEGEDGATATQQPVPPDIGQPGATAWALAGATIGPHGSTTPALVFTGAVDDDYASAILFEYRINDGSDPAVATDWIGTDVAATNVTRREITAGSGISYYGAVSYIVDGQPGDRRILGPVTAGILDAGSAGVTPVSDGSHTVGTATIVTSRGLITSIT